VHDHLTTTMFILSGGVVLVWSSLLLIVLIGEYRLRRVKSTQRERYEQPRLRLIQGEKKD